MLCSSQVTTAPHSLAALMTISSSSGLMVQRLMTRAWDALVFQMFGGSEGFAHLQAGGKNRHVVALGELLALANLKFEAGFVMEYRHRQAAEPQVDGALVLIGGLDGGAGFHVVGRAKHRHAGDGAHKREILAALVGGTVLAHRDAAVGGTDLHVQVGVTDGVAHLFEGAARGEHGKAGGERHKPHGRHAGGGGHHIALGNAAVKMTVGVGLLEHAGLGGGGQVGIQHHHVGMVLRQFHQRRTVAVPGGYLFDLTHSCASSPASWALSSSMAILYSSSLGALPCQPTWFSI